jgi:hypothetical protein
MKKIYKILLIAGCGAIAAVIIFVSVSSGNPSNPVAALQVMQEAQTSASQSVATFVPETTETPAITPATVSPGATTAAATASNQANTNPKPSSSDSTGSGSGSGTVPKSTPTPAPNPTNAPTPKPTETPAPQSTTAPTGAPTPCPSQDAQQTIDDTHDWIDDNHPTPAPPDPSQPGIGNW